MSNFTLTAECVDTGQGCRDDDWNFRKMEGANAAPIFTKDENTTSDVRQSKAQPKIRASQDFKHLGTVSTDDTTSTSNTSQIQARSLEGLKRPGYTRSKSHIIAHDVGNEIREGAIKNRNSQSPIKSRPLSGDAVVITSKPKTSDSGVSSSSMISQKKLHIDSRGHDKGNTVFALPLRNECDSNLCCRQMVVQAKK